MGKKEDKLNEIENYLEELESILPLNIEAYKKDIEKRAACERYFEKIIESIIDLTFILIKEDKLEIIENEERSFFVLSENKIISKELADKLTDAKGMRNFIIHQYDKIDDELVFEAVTEKLIPDVREFLNSVKELK